MSSDIEIFMMESGYSLKRKRKHAVWQKGDSQIVTSSTSSDRRAISNIRAIVKKHELRSNKEESKGNERNER